MRDKVWGMIGAVISWIIVTALIVWAWKEGVPLVRVLMIVLGVLNTLSILTDMAIIQSIEGKVRTTEGMLIGAVGFALAAYILVAFLSVIPYAFAEFYWPIEEDKK
ncbi:MAG: hypothetical protein WC243_04265 [Patescibacteria group bacterium]|jgi:hypothetical protein